MVYKSLILISLSIFTFNVNFLFANNNGAEFQDCSSAKLWSDNNENKGWFWKKECIPLTDQDNPIVNNQSVRQDNYTILENKQDIPWDILDILDPDEIAERVEPTARKVAITYPTKENILEYRKLSKWIQDKTVTFMNVDRMVRTENPNEILAGLSNSEKRGNFESRVSRVIRNEAVDSVLNRYSERAGLIIFVSPTCYYCKMQIPILDELKRVYNFGYVMIDVTDKNEMVREFGIETTPDIFLAINSQEKKYQRIATGLHTLQDLVSAIIYGLQYLGEDIDENAIN